MRFQISPKVAAGIVGILVLAVPAVAQFEGLWLVAKPDTLAYGIPTVCYGETEGVKVGDRYTKEQCQQKLAEKLPRYLNEINRCIKVPISDKTRAAYLSLAYNIGSGAFCRSTALKRLNAGTPVSIERGDRKVLVSSEEGSCEAMMMWTRAGGKFVKGLENRRKVEVSMCLEGLKEPRRAI